MALRSLAAMTSALALLAGCDGGTPAADASKTTEAVAPDAVASTTEAPDAIQAAQAVTIPPPPADPLAVGSQDAKDDMYCSALIYYENPDVSDALAPVDEALLRKAQMLGFIIGEAGINKLVSEKAVHATHARIVGDAYADQVAKDVKANKPRISLDQCNKRAVALPIPE